MRIWVGVHPSELDNQRLLALHNEVHMMIGIIRNARESNRNPGELCLDWNDSKGLAALYYLHNLVSGPCFDRLGYKHNSDLMISTAMIEEVDVGYAEISELFLNGHDHGLGTPKRWPPKWISPQQKIADLMDLQIRWANESKRVELDRSIERYGSYPGGLLSGSRTDSSTVSDVAVERFLKHREERVAYLANKAKEPQEVPVETDPKEALKQRLGVE